MEMKRFSRGDLKLIAVLLLVGLALFAFLTFSRRDGRQVIVRVDGQAVALLSLSQDVQYPIENNGTVTNTLVIHDGTVRMAEADCPDHLCIRRGAIRYAGSSIICLPNRVVAEITGEDALNLDAVAG